MRRYLKKVNNKKISIGFIKVSWNLFMCSTNPQTILTTILKGITMLLTEKILQVEDQRLRQFTKSSKQGKNFKYETSLLPKRNWI